MPYYIFKAPNSVIKAIEKLQMDFLWELGDSRKDYLIKCEIMCRLVELGSLGLGDLML